jgi:hypothetical protein
VNFPSDHRRFAHFSPNLLKSLDRGFEKLASSLLTDYEGISGYEAFRGDLSLMYFPHLDLATGELVACQISPMRVHRFQLQRASTAETLWLRDILQSEGQRFGTGVAITPEHTLTLQWHDQR